MNSGNMPNYKYRPVREGIPSIRSRSVIRARLATENFFRATDAGNAGNNISIGIEAVQNSQRGVLIVTNHNQVRAENIVSTNRMLSLSILDVRNITYKDYFTVRIIDSDSMSITRFKRTYERVNQFSDEVISTDTVYIKHGYTIPGLLSFKIDALRSNLTAGEFFHIQPRLQLFELVQSNIVIEEVTYSGWDLSVRNAIQTRAQTDGWIEMPPRGFDVQDNGRPDTEFVLRTFPDTYLAGGGGLPDSPSGEVTGLIRSVVHINYGERYNGSMGTVNTMYEWVGDDAMNGEWRDLFK